jgi:hypothetical protein
LASVLLEVDQEEPQPWLLARVVDVLRKGGVVVVPTDTHVRLHFEPSTVDRLAYLLTLLGIVMCVVMRIRGDVKHRSPNPYLPAVVPAAPPAPPTASSEGEATPDEWGELDWDDPGWTPSPGATQSTDGPGDAPGSV